MRQAAACYEQWSAQIFNSNNQSGYTLYTSTGLSLTASHTLSPLQTTWMEPEAVQLIEQSLNVS